MIAFDMRYGLLVDQIKKKEKENLVGNLYAFYMPICLVFNIFSSFISVHF